jgi:hypothetical protein
MLSSSCAVKIHDHQFCSPIPNHGAACDNLLTKKPIILDDMQWAYLQMKWASRHQAMECTTSDSLADFKTDIEQLCSKTSCEYLVSPVKKNE